MSLRPATHRQIDRLRRDSIARYPPIWGRVTREWRSEGGDGAWLLYSANYLLRTHGVRWAIDPLTPRWRYPAAEDVPIAKDLSPVTFVLLTHGHRDHLDLHLLRSLRGQPILWIVPEAIRRRVIQAGGLRPEDVLAAEPGRPLEIEGVRLTPFMGLHFEGQFGRWENCPGAASREVPSLGYLVEFNAKRWMFPGDTRTYDARLIPRFSQVDGAFLHVWLGRGGALREVPPLFDEFCRFGLDLNARRLVLTHLEDFARPDADVWTVGHARMLSRRLRSMAPGVPVEWARPGDRIDF